MSKRALISLAILAIFLLPRPCVALFGSISMADEAEMGREFHAKIQHSVHFVDDPYINDYVTEIVEHIYAQVPSQAFKTTTSVVANNALNAFAVPGGYVYVFTGLIAGLENEDQLAAVISHELGHVTQRHVVDRMKKMEKVNIASTVGSMAGLFLGMAASENNEGLGQALTIGSQAAAHTAFLVYTQENEREADHVGLNYLVQAGYNPFGLPQTFELMARNRFQSVDNSVPGYLYTHPQLADRVAYLNERIKKLPEAIHTRPYTSKEFLKIRALVRGRVSDPSWTIATIESQSQRTCYDDMAMGMALTRLKQTDKAKQFFQKALARAGDDPLVLRQAGRFYFKIGDFTKALKYLDKALYKQPDDIYALYTKSRLLGEQGNYSAAVQYMKRVLEKVTKDMDVYYHLAHYEGAMGDTFHGYLHLAYSELYAGDTPNMNRNLEKAKNLAKNQKQKKEIESFEKARQEFEDEK